MSTNICPPLMRLFEEVKTGRPLYYTPMQLAEEFEKYINYIQVRPIAKTAKKAKNILWNFFRITMQEQLQQECPSIPRVSDFVVRWLGKDMRWWGNLDDDGYAQVKYRIQTYCRIVKLNGAAVGMVDAGVIGREIAMLNKMQNGNNNED